MTQLSTTMLGALGSLPVRLTTNNGTTYYLPAFAPSGATLAALQKRGLAECDGRVWTRTPLGESTWEHR